MNNSERRSVLSTQHRHLRDLIAQIRKLAAVAEPAALRDGITALVAEMQAHMATEETLLGPILERIDAWGPVRLDLMRAEHAHQRGVMAFLTSRAADALTPQELAKRTLMLLDDILADMDAEDRDILDPKVLQDDVIQLDASDA
jgi:iron-sulfur cluster repair protein YtfE (RIC family)